MGANSWPKTVTQHRRGCDLNPGPTAPESNTLTTRLPSHANYEDSVMSRVEMKIVAGVCRQGSSGAAADAACVCVCVCVCVDVDQCDELQRERG